MQIVEGKKIMSKNLVIVESPAKAKTIEGFLGKDFTVKSSFGHIRDLPKDDSAIDIEKKFEPKYVIPADKKKVVAELKKLAKEAETVWLATDEDREGEAISWHLFDALNLTEEKTKRIVFHEITKPAIQHAVANPRTINIDLVNAQQARRILDRLVGFELSPVLWRKIKPSLSAGRVQSVAVRLIVEREREVIAFGAENHFKVTAQFFPEGKDKSIFSAELNRKFNTEEEAMEFMTSCKAADYKIADLETKPAKRSPAPPFTTSTLQQEASRKLGYSVSRTMMLAQKLYESGKITYMRTDSVNLSDTALAAAQQEIKSAYGDDFHQQRKFKTKSSGAQEAHEAIRPSYFEQHSLNDGTPENRLYELIWKRAIASQMSEARFEKTTAKIQLNNRDENFVARGEIMKFEGFLKVYMEGSDDDEEEEQDQASIGSKDDVVLPPLELNMALGLAYAEARERFTRPPARYTEASLVKKLEELGIGRPSTY
ncbi:MAG: DNA topoisomerase-1, partial [Sphingobacteriales bacterium]